MQLSGVSICTAPPSIPKGSPLSPTFRPSEVHGFVRSLRYNPGNAATNAQDLFDAVLSSDACKDLEIFLLVSDKRGRLLHGYPPPHHVVRAPVAEDGSRYDAGLGLCR